MHSFPRCMKQQLYQTSFCTNLNLQFLCSYSKYQFSNNNGSCFSQLHNRGIFVSSVHAFKYLFNFVNIETLLLLSTSKGGQLLRWKVYCNFPSDLNWKLFMNSVQHEVIEVVPIQNCFIEIFINIGWEVSGTNLYQIAIFWKQSFMQKKFFL